MLELVVRREQKNVNFDEICVSLSLHLHFPVLMLVGTLREKMHVVNSSNRCLRISNRQCQPTI